jgi:hypothetical protein
MRRVVGFAVAIGAAALVAPAPIAHAATVKRTASRSWELTVTAPPSPDLTVVRLTFPKGAFSPRPTRAPLRVRALSDGIDLTVAAGRLFPWRRRTVSLLIVLAHRHPRGALYPDVASVRFAVSGTRLTHRPALDEVVGAFNRRGAAAAAAPALCRDRQEKVTDEMGGALLSAGPDLGFPPAHVMAEGYDVACARPVDPAFERAFTEFDRCPPPPPCGPAYSDRPCIQPAATTYPPCPEPL